MPIVKLLFWICSGILTGIGIAALYSGFYDVLALVVLGLAFNIKLMFVLNSKH